jgi:general secretion pathway protein D
MRNGWKVLLLIAVFAVPLSLRAQEGGNDDDQDDTTTAAPTPQHGAPGAPVPPDVLRKGLEGLRMPGPGIKTNISREPGPGGSATPAATPQVATTPASTATPTPTPAHAVAATPAPTATDSKIGNGMVQTHPTAPKPLPWNEKVTIGQIDDTDLEEVIRNISRATARNFIYDKKDVRNQKVTIIMPTPLTVGELYQAFQTALEGAGLTLVQVGPNLIKIMPRRDAATKPLDTGSITSDALPWNDSFVTRIIRLQNIDVGQIQGILQQLSSKDGAQVQAFAPTNSLIITDTANNIRRLSKIIDELDRSGGEENIEVVRIHHADVQDIAQKIQDLFGQTGAQPGGARPGAAQIRRPPLMKGTIAPGTPGAPENGSDVGSSAPMVSKVIPDQRTNQVIVVANDRGIQAVMDLLSKIDVDVDEAGTESIHVYYLQNADAEELATVLANLAQGQAGGSQPGGNRNRPGINPAVQPGGIQGQNPAANGNANANAPLAVLEGDVKITSDKSTNALVITASRSDYQTLENVIKKLDIRRQQVYVEAAILEMTVNKARNLGLSFGGGASAGNAGTVFGGSDAGTALFLDPTKLATGLALGLIGPGGVSVPITGVDGKPTTLTIPPFGVVLQALETDSDIDVLSRPNVLAKENEESEIVVATSVAVPGNVTISQTGLQNFSITHEDVGITLRLTPKINESDHVSLQVFEEVKNIVNDQTVGTQRLVDTGKRSAKTNVVVKSGQTVVIGGLLTDNDTNSESKIPILGDIPFLGWLFRQSKRTATKQNLLIFLTPTIINDDSDMDLIYKKRMEEREQFMKLYANSIARKQNKKKDLFGMYRDHDAASAPAEPAVKPAFEPVQPVPTVTPAPVQPAPDATPAPKEPNPIPDEPPTGGSTTNPTPTPTPEPF